MVLLKSFVYGLLPYILVGIITALLIGCKLWQAIVIISVMVVFNILVNILKEVMKNINNGTIGKK